MNFEVMRKSALEYWLLSAKRVDASYKQETLDIRVNIREDGYECEWQEEAENITGIKDIHVCQFCSIGDEADSITDILCDERYDKLEFTDLEDAKILYRYYSRYFLYCINVIDDLERLANRMGYIENKDKGRQEIAATAITNGSEPLKIHYFVDFTSSISKHKLPKSDDRQGFHGFNNHLPKLFEDSRMDGKEPKNTVLSMINTSPQNIEAIEMPSILLPISIISTCYEFISMMNAKHRDKFKEFCENNNKPPANDKQIELSQFYQSIS